MQEYYKALGLNENASDEQIDMAYNSLKSKYSKERFLEGEEGNQAARNLTFLEVAYKEIKESRMSTNDSNGNSSFSEVELKNTFFHCSVSPSQIIKVRNFNLLMVKSDKSVLPLPVAISVQAIGAFFKKCSITAS